MATPSALRLSAAGAVLASASCFTVPELKDDAALRDFDLPLAESHGEHLVDDEREVVRTTQRTLLRLVALKHRLTDREPRAARDVHAKQHGCARGELVVDADVPVALRYGLFAAAGRYIADVRFSTSEPGPYGDDWDTSLKGMGVKVRGVVGERFDVVGDDEDDTQDFAFNNRPMFPLRDVRDYGDAMMTRLLRYERGPLADLGFAVGHADRLPSLLLETNRVASPLLTTFHSQTPIAVGPQTTKMAFRPCRVRQAANAAPIVRANAFSSRDYLKERVQTDLGAADHCFELVVQERPRADESAFPVEDASVVWSVKEAPMVKVATLHLPRQDITALSAQCDAWRINPWHSLVAHRPLGSLNRSRRALYDALATFRAAHAPTQ